MKSISIHACEPNPSTGRVPFVTVVQSGRARLNLDFEDMGEASIPCVQLSLASLYEVLQGKDHTVALPGIRVCLHPSANECAIRFEFDDGREPVEFRVWLSELALAWNILTGYGIRPGSGPATDPD